MFRKSIISVVLCVTLLFFIFTLVSAQEPGKETYQMDGTPTAAPLPVEATPIPELPLSNQSAAQSGTCPMMSGSGVTTAGGMSGMGMNGMSGMQGTSGMNMGSTSGTQGMPGGTMSMGGMASMNMTGMNGPIVTYATSWYTNPWLMLGWVLLVLIVLAALAGIVLGVQTLRQRSKAVAPVEIP